jgi:serine protease Do
MNMRLRCFNTVLVVLLAGGVCVPSTYAQSRISQILSLDDSSGAYLGIHMTDVTEDNRTDYKLDDVAGVIVQTVEEGSPAGAGGLKEKDVILEFDGIKVRSTIQFQRLVQETPVGRKVELLISRAGKQMPVSARLERRNERLQAEGSRVFPNPLNEPNSREFFYRSPNYPDLRMPDAIQQRTGRLGVTLQPLSEQLAEYLGVPGKKGVLVSSVLENSPSSGKLKAGDVIIQAKSSDIESPQELADLIREQNGGAIKLKVIRNKKEVAVEINLTSDSDKGFRL